MPKAFQIKDTYFFEAKKRGYRSRSAFKLLEIQKKYHFVRRGDSVLDLGSSPGGWLQVLIELTGSVGRILGIDIKPIEKISGVTTYICDIFDHETLDSFLKGSLFDVITSDMAPNTSGIKDIDQARSVELCERAFEVAQIHLKAQGNLLMKVFSGSDFAPFFQKIKKNFRKVSVFKPQSSRDRSRETFIVAMGKI